MFSIRQPIKASGDARQKELVLPPEERKVWLKEEIKHRSHSLKAKLP